MGRVYLIGGIVVLLVIAWMIIAPRLMDRAAPKRETSTAIAPREVLPFQLTNHRGEQVKLGDMRGKVWVANFIFTSCPGPCRDVTRRVREIDQALVHRKDVQLVSFTIDPETDTPHTLATYARQHDASERWHFLTGSRLVTAKVAQEGFLLPMSTEAGDFTHSDKLVVVDREGRARFWIDTHAEDAVAQTVRAIDSLG